MKKATPVSKAEFKQAVETWKRKGHSNVVEVAFNSSTINLYCPDYVDPEITYCINVIDTREID